MVAAQPGARERATAADWIVYAPLLILFLTYASLRVEGDTIALLAGADNARLCLEEGKFPCNRYVAHFPIFQYLFAVPALAAGVGSAAVATGLAWASVGFGLLAAATFFRFGRAVAGLAGAHLALALLFTGYAIFYFFDSFNEMAAFALFAVFTAAAYQRRHWALIMSLAFLCCITKEVAAPFVALTYVAAHIAGRDLGSIASTFKDGVAGAVPVIAGIAAGVAVNAAFNWFRFGTLVNVVTLNPNFRTPSSAVTAYFSYLFISPAGGLVYVWLSFAAFAAAALVASRKRDHDLVVIGLAFLIVAGANAGLAFWWSSFGWYAWGPRLTLPFLGTAALLLVCRSEPLLQALRAGPFPAVRIAAVFAVLFVSMLPNVLILAAPGDFFSRMFAPTTINALLGPNVLTLEKVGPEVLKLGAMESYGRNVVIPTTLAAARKYPLIVALAAAYAALAAWRICRRPRAAR